MTERESYLDLQLRRYASGEDVSRVSIVENIVGRYRPYLRGSSGPNYDGSLAADIEKLIEAVEQRCRLK